MLCSARGFPLGEHGRVGPCDGALFGELVQVPWMMRFPDAAGAAVRSPALVEPADLWATLLDWWGAAGRLPLRRAWRRGEGRVAHGEPVCCRLAAGQLAPRSAIGFAWRATAAGRSAPPPGSSAPAEQPELFAKPDDRWEVNNVASLLPGGGRVPAGRPGPIRGGPAGRPDRRPAAAGRRADSRTGMRNLEVKS